tara:strand:- start:541 stop:3219 length:2679 start_codon:yes stop_codon:yes gene_type:complete
MTTYYVDFTNGGQAATGQSVAQARNNFIGLNGGSGDVIKVAGSPNPTLVGSASCKAMQGYPSWNPQNMETLHYQSGAGNSYIQSAYFGGQNNDTRRKWETGDCIQIVGSSANSGELNGTWNVTKLGAWGSGNHDKLKLDEFVSSTTSGSLNSPGKWYNKTPQQIIINSQPIINLASTGQRSSAWTAAQYATATLDENLSPEWISNQRKTWEHSKSDLLEVNDSHGTGLVAYIPITELSDGQWEQISFYACYISGSKLDGWSMRLCTNNDGTGSVKTIPLPEWIDTNDYKWRPIVKDFGEGLTSNGNIKSIAIYIDTDRGARSIRLSNIIGCKASDQADSITHLSLLSWNTTIDPQWMNISSIKALANGKTRIIIHHGKLDAEPNGYYGQGHMAGWRQSYTNANLYKRECVYLDSYWMLNYSQPIDIGNNFYSSNPQNAGVTISGGWSSDFSTQNLDHTIVSGQFMQRKVKVAGLGVEMDKMGFAHFGQGFTMNGGRNLSIDNLIISGTSHEYGNSISFDNVHIRKFKSIGWANTSQAAINFQNCKCIKDYGTNTDTNNPVLATTAEKDNFSIQHCGAGGGAYMNVNNDGQHIVLGLVDLSTTCYFQRTLDFQADAKGYFYCDTFKAYWNYAGITNYSTSTHNFKTIYTNSIANNSIAMGSNGGTIVCEDFESVKDLTYYWYTNEANNVYIANGGTFRVTNSFSIQEGRIYLNSSNLLTRNDTFDSNNTYYNSPISMQGNSSWQKKDAGGVSGALETQYNYGYIYPETTIRKTASGYAWKFATAASSTSSSLNPLNLPLGTIVVNSGTAVTITVWVYRQTNTGGIGQLIVKNNSLIGLSLDLTDTTSANADTWEQLSCTFTPTAAGFVDIEIQAYRNGGNGAVIFDDVGVTQV